MRRTCRQPDDSQGFHQSADPLFTAVESLKFLRQHLLHIAYPPAHQSILLRIWLFYQSFPQGILLFKQNFARRTSPRKVFQTSQS